MVCCNFYISYCHRLRVIICFIISRKSEMQQWPLGGVLGWVVAVDFKRSTPVICCNFRPIAYLLFQKNFIYFDAHFPENLGFGEMRVKMWMYTFDVNLRAYCCIGQGPNHLSRLAYSSSALFDLAAWKTSQKRSFEKVSLHVATMQCPP